jgi:hypothetical protein
MLVHACQTSQINCCCTQNVYPIQYRTGPLNSPGVMVSPPHSYVPRCYNDPKTPTPISIGQGLSNGLVLSSQTLVCTILVSDQISDSHILSNRCTSLFPHRINTSNTGLVSCIPILLLALVILLFRTSAPIHSPVPVL